MEDLDRLLLCQYNPKHWSGPLWSSAAIDQNGSMMENPETNLTLEKPSVFSTDYSDPSQIELDSLDLFSGLNLDLEYKLLADICVDPVPIEELNKDITNQSNCNEVPNDVKYELNYVFDYESEEKFLRESIFFEPNEATSYSGLPDISLLNQKSPNNEDEIKLRPSNWFMADHNYCSDRSTNETVEAQANKPTGVNTKKNVELEVDVWGTIRDGNPKMLGARSFFQPQKLGTIWEAMDCTGLHYDVAGMNKLPAAKCFSPVSVLNLRIALETHSASRRSARNIRPKGSVETTPSCSDFEDGCNMYMKPAPPRRIRSNRCSGPTKRKRSACRSANKFNPYQLNSEEGQYRCLNEKPPKRTRVASQSVSRALNQANRRALGRNVPKSTKKKTLKEKQGHKDNEKLRRDKLRDAFTNLKAEIPLSYLIRYNDKPTAMISKQKILNGALTKSTEMLKLKKRRTKGIKVFGKTLQIYQKTLARSRAQMSMNSYK